MKSVSIMYNEDKEIAVELYNEAKDFFEKESFAILDRSEAIKADIIIIIGGDGTLLRASKELICNKETPIIAVNAGSLGFLTEIRKEEALATYERVISGNYEIEERSFLRIVAKEKEYYALNEVVIAKGETLGKLVKVRVEANNRHVNTYRSDGLIVATPTGSTAYSLSAGGPILQPTLKAMVLTPIAPHNLGTRPIVIDSRETLTLKIEEERCGFLIIDGEEIVKIKKDEKIEVGYSEKVFKLVVPENRNYYEVLREKLNWGDELC